jgi:hypothetical protein
MNTVSMWACKCGAHYRCLSSFRTEEDNILSIFTCPKCEARKSITGHIVYVQNESNSGKWTTMDGPLQNTKQG